MEVLYNWIQDGGPRHSVGKQRRATPPVAAAGDKKLFSPRFLEIFVGGAPFFGFFWGFVFML